MGKGGRGQNLMTFFVNAALGLIPVSIFFSGTGSGVPSPICSHSKEMAAFVIPPAPLSILI